MARRGLLMLENENSLIARVLAGDRAASCEFYITHQPLVARICHRYLSRDDAQEMVQEAFIRIYLKLHLYTPSPRGIRPWLAAVACNLCHNHLRSRRRRVEVLMSDVPHSVVWELPDIFFWQDLAALTGPLHPALAETFCLFVSGMSPQEIAEKLDVKIGTVRTRLFRARQALRRHQF